MNGWLRQAYHGAKRIPLLRRIARLPVISRLKLAVANRWLVASRDYRRWITLRIEVRRRLYRATAEPGLLSFLTTAWNTPPRYLMSLARSLLDQAGPHSFEWVLLDNGSTDPATAACLDELARNPLVRFQRVRKNLGIVGGMRSCLHRATGRYVLPLDSDDRLYEDCLSVLTWHIREHNFPAILYSDEDKIMDGKVLLPYFKPDWDPVLLINAAYIAHLGAFDRKLALELGVYGQDTPEGCHDWDTFLRFQAAGHVPLHVAEVIYSWRMHPQSTAMNITSKSFIHTSHRTLLERFLARQERPEWFSLDRSPLFDGTPDWWIRRKHVDARALVSVVLGDPAPTDCSTVLASCDYPEHRAVGLPTGSPAATLGDLAKEQTARGGLVCLVSDALSIENREWPWEVLALCELHKDTAVVGGHIHTDSGITMEAGRYLGFGDGCGCPDRGRSVHDPGYNAQTWKQRSVSAVSTQFCVFDAGFLLEVLEQTCPPGASLPFLGAWAGAHALRTARRVVYSPFLSGSTEEDWDARVRAGERTQFLRANRDIIPDRRFYSPLLSLYADRAYLPADEDERRERLRRLYESKAQD